MMANDDDDGDLGEALHFKEHMHEFDILRMWLEYGHDHCQRERKEKKGNVVGDWGRTRIIALW